MISGLLVGRGKDSSGQEASVDTINGFDERVKSMKIAPLPWLLMCSVMLSIGCSPQGSTSVPASGIAAAKSAQPVTALGTDPTRCVRFSPDGKSLATANVDNTVSVWDRDAKEEIARLTVSVNNFETTSS